MIEMDKSGRSMLLLAGKMTFNSSQKQCVVWQNVMHKHHLHKELTDEQFRN